MDELKNIESNNQEDHLKKSNNLENEASIQENKPTKRIRKKATLEQLSNPLHGVKLKELLESLVKHYGWDYLGKRTNINCFKFNPTMKSSLGFLRKTTWAREFVEDIYVEMIEKR